MRLKELKSKVEYDPKNRMDDITAQRMAKFGDMVDSDRKSNPDAVSISMGDTNKLIAQARAQLKHDRISDTKAHAHRKDGVHKQGFKPVKFPPVKWEPNARTKVDYLDGGRQDVGEIKEAVKQAIQEHIKQKVPFTECMFRPGSEAFTLFYRTVKGIREHLDLDWQDEELLDTDIGECVIVEGELVPLDVPMEATNDFDDETDMYSASDAEAENSVEYGIVRYPDTSISYVKNAFGQGWMHIYDASYGYEGPLDQADMKYLSLIDADQVPSRLREDDRRVIGVDPKDLDDEELEQFKALMQRAAKLDNLERDNDGTYHPGGAGVVKRAGKPSKTNTPMVGLGILKKNEDLEESQLDEKSCGEKGVKPNSPKRGGSKKFYVYVNTPSGNCKKISWGDTTGLSVKAKDRGAVRSFVARHKCKQANDRTTARYWSCRTPRYKSLGVKGGQWW